MGGNFTVRGSGKVKSTRNILSILCPTLMLLNGYWPMGDGIADCRSAITPVPGNDSFDIAHSEIVVLF